MPALDLNGSPWGCVMTLQGLSGTGKGTTVDKLKEKLPNAQTWSPLAIDDWAGSSDGLLFLPILPCLVVAESWKYIIREMLPSQGVCFKLFNTFVSRDLLKIYFPNGGATTGGIHKEYKKI